jgi:hypothetical protein
MNSENKTISQNKHSWTSDIAVAIFAIAWFVFGYYFVLTLPKNNTVVYDCSLAEFHPDYPIQVKEACRKVRSGRI